MSNAKQKEEPYRDTNSRDTEKQDLIQDRLDGAVQTLSFLLLFLSSHSEKPAYFDALVTMSGTCVHIRFSQGMDLYALPLVAPDTGP